MHYCLNVCPATVASLTDRSNVEEAQVRRRAAAPPFCRHLGWRCLAWAKGSRSHDTWDCNLMFYQIVACTIADGVSESIGPATETALYRLMGITLMAVRKVSRRVDSVEDRCAVEVLRESYGAHSLLSHYMVSFSLSRQATIWS